MKVILFTTLLLFSINGFAFNWKKVVASTVGDSYYVDIDNIKKHKGLVYYWSMVDYLEPQDGTNSYIAKFKVNCVEEKRTWLSFTTYSQPMGKGRINTDITPNEIQYPKPNSVGYDLMRFVCNNAKQRIWGLLTFQTFKT